MTLQELLEAAQLEALGLLDEDEAKAFEIAFHAADPRVQAAVRAEQARWARTPGDLIEGEPPADLRARVLAAVGEAMGHPEPADSLTESRLRQEIIGSIGTHNRLLGAPVAGRVSAGWRAGALGLAAAAAILLAAFFYVDSQNDRLRDRMSSDAAIQAMTKGFGPALWRGVAFDAATQRVVFQHHTPARAEALPNARVALFWNPEWPQPRLFAEGLESLKGQTYRVVLIDDEHQITSEVADLGAGGELVTTALSIKPAKGMRLAIAAAAPGARPSEADILLIAVVA